MATLNKSKTAEKLEKISAEETVNFEGAVAYTYPDKTRLINRVLGAFWNENLFYVGGKPLADDTIADIKKVASIDPKFPLQLAAYARNELYLRTTPQVILVVCANIAECKPFIREYAPKIIKRADELAAVTAFQLSQYGKPIPNSLKKGIADAFATFDEYQLNKYDSDKKSVSLGDVLKLINRKKDYPVSQAMANYLEKDEVDPIALPKIYALKQMFAKDSLDEEAKSLIKQSSATWETVISKFGSSKETWETVIPNMGYMALLRNLRNFTDKDVDLIAAGVLVKIQDPEQVKRSKQLPFRFYSAYKNVRDKQIIQRAIAQAFEHSLTNVTLDGSTAILVDLSGSMTSGRVSDKSDVSYAEIAAVLGAIAAKKAAESTTVGFGDSAAIVHLNPDDTMITNIGKIINTNVGHSTNAWLAFDELLEKNIKVDRVILISDMQCYNDRAYGYGSTKPESVRSKWAAYRKINPNARLYSLDVSAYGTSQLPSADGSVTQISGWSDKILDYINLTEKADVMEKQITKW